MDPTVISIIVILSFLIFLMAGMPVFGALGLASVIGILLVQGPRGLGAVPGVIYDRLAGFVLVAVPLFILMGEIIFISGIGADIYTATSRWLNKLCRLIYQCKNTLFDKNIFKQEKVKEIEQKQITVAQISRLYNVSRSAVHKWIRLYGSFKQKGERIVVEKESEAHKTLELLKKVADLERLLCQTVRG